MNYDLDAAQAPGNFKPNPEGNKFDISENNPSFFTINHTKKPVDKTKHFFQWNSRMKCCRKKAAEGDKTIELGSSYKTIEAIVVNISNRQHLMC